MRKPFFRGIQIGAAALVCGLLVVPSSWARWMAPTQMPVERLLKNVRDYVKAHPKDAHGYYTLGRINSAAFAQDAETIGVYTRGALPDVPAHSGLIPPPRNSNGVSDPGEIVSLTALGIKRIAAHSAGLSDGVPANPAGIQLRDGSSLPTFDWTPTSLPATLTRRGESRVN